MCVAAFVTIVPAISESSWNSLPGALCLRYVVGGQNEIPVCRSPRQPRCCFLLGGRGEGWRWLEGAGCRGVAGIRAVVGSATILQLQHEERSTTQRLALCPECYTVVLMDGLLNDICHRSQARGPKLSCQFVMLCRILDGKLVHQNTRSKAPL